jgi:uncharacterized paraquat-inducible protein A
MKLSRYTMLGMVGVGILLIVWIGLMLFSGSSQKKIGPAKEDLTHCPDCGMLLNKAGECPKCMAEEGVEAYRAKRANKGAATNPTIAFVLAAIFVVLVAVHAAVVLRGWSVRGKDEDLYYIHCRKCGRKLRFRERQIGHIGRCPLCQTPIRFPHPEEEGKGNHWVKLVHAIWG